MQKTKLLISTFIVLILLAACVMAFRHLGRWLIREEPLSSADVMVVLSGGMPYRAEEAGKIFRMGYARELWVSRPESPTLELRELGIRYVAEEEYNRQILIHEGVPEAAVRILPEIVVNTEQELQEVGREMQRAGKSRLIIVTSPEHTRRVGTLWRKLVGQRFTLIVHAARQDQVDPDHWWRNTRDALAVLRETLGLMNAWAGLPVRPHSEGMPVEHRDAGK
jgi:uncharacterized SAM-binding protein YcdF (DUF218 family)